MIYLSAIVSKNDSCWIVNIEINGQHMTFKLDTGAEVTAITESTLAKLGKVKLSPVTKSLCGPDRKPLEVTGSIGVARGGHGRAFALLSLNFGLPSKPSSYLNCT